MLSNLQGQLISVWCPQQQEEVPPQQALLRVLFPAKKRFRFSGRV